MNKMITHKKYLEALETINIYHSQITSQIELIENNILKLDCKQSKKVKCIYNYACGHNLTWLTIGKEYNIMKNPYKRGWNVDDKNNHYFSIIDNNGKKRIYPYKNPSGVWEFIM